MLHDNQTALLDFLRQYPVADGPTCLSVMDTEKTRDLEALSYQMRPLVKHRYITRRSDGLYSLLMKGESAATTEHSRLLISCGGNSGARKRAAEISGIAALLLQYGIPSGSEIPPDGQNLFIPSPIWRRIRKGIVSTSRFLGMLYFKDMRLAVYNIADGTMEWQTYAERSLHFRSYGSYETRATGILMVCDNGLGVETGRQIITRTMWNRKNLIKDPNDYSWENPKKRPVSKSPIKLHSDYGKAYLAERNDLLTVLETAAAGQKITDFLCADLKLTENRDWRGRFLENHTERYFVNLQNDLLFLTVFFKQMKELYSGDSPIKCRLIMRKRYSDLGRIYAGIGIKLFSVPEEILKCMMS